ncbi:hypothetical protein M407DRAFT_33378 [Tulasnella calospora MUT 4182]|uniref:Amino acid permease/ SLC12A domain-containing protein n=1 Tax=Tulasnella calospora MUT 4182 TaxID=1051891 RepID=A0A0C3Q2F8_9AGAM|nr:hypothetical protein M407DRAFT_33378 [Tulasnella calospora MUT 4182]
MFITAAVMAEICSALPLSGSIYIWAAESAGPKYARFAGVVVAWWICTAWMTFSAYGCQAVANYIVSLLVVMILTLGWAETPDTWKSRLARWYSLVFKIALGLMILDFSICVIWLPIGAHKTYGFRSAKEVFTGTYNGTGAPAGWNWILSFFFAAWTLTGFDAAGHIAEETKNASVIAAKGIFASAVATGCFGFVTTVLFLFCTPDLDTINSLSAPQPFVQIYALALGRGGAVFMTILAAVGLLMNTSIAIVAASRLIFAVARDGVLPLSWWIGRVSKDGQPRNAVTVMYVFGAALLCVILASNVAFTSLVSAGGVPTIAAYGLIGFLRLTMTPDSFRSTKFKLGVFRRPMYAATAFFQAIVLSVMVSPFFFPVTAVTFNFAGVILGAVTIFAIIMYLVTPEDKWLTPETVRQACP